jgi:hypothetical protein
MKNLEIKITKNNNGLVSKEFAEKTRVFGSPEFKAWREFLEVFPNAKMVIDKKKANDKLTYEKMQLYIKLKKSELLEEFERIKELSKVQKSPYNYVLKWFKTYCPKYNENPISEIEENKNTNNNNEIDA